MELARPAARSVGALRELSEGGTERLLAPEIGPPFLPCHFDHRQKCQSKHRQRDVSIPAFPMPHFVVIQPDLLFGQFNGFFHLPAAACRPHDLLQGHRLRRKDEVIGELGGIGETPPGQQPLLPSRLRQAKRKLLPGPIVEARPLTALPCRETLPGGASQLATTSSARWVSPIR